MRLYQLWVLHKASKKVWCVTRSVPHIVIGIPVPYAASQAWVHSEAATTLTPPLTSDRANKTRNSKYRIVLLEYALRKAAARTTAAAAGTAPAVEMSFRGTRTPPASQGEGK